MTTEAEHAPTVEDVSPKGTNVVVTAEKEDDKISVGEMDEVNLEEGTRPGSICCVGETYTKRNLCMHCTTQLLFRKEHIQHY
jgi:hypothetical protein